MQLQCGGGIGLQSIKTLKKQNKKIFKSRRANERKFCSSIVYDGLKQRNQGNKIEAFKALSTRIIYKTTEFNGKRRFPYTFYFCLVI